jgi:hypothetical protein
LLPSATEQGFPNSIAHVRESLPEALGTQAAARFCSTGGKTETGENMYAHLFDGSEKRPFAELYHSPSGSSRVRAQPSPKEAQQYVRFAICKSTFIFLTLAMSCCTCRSTTRLKEMTR